MFHILTDKNQQMIKVKINIKKNENNNINDKKKIKIIKKNIVTDSINSQQKIKIDKNKIYNSNSSQMTFLKNKGVIPKIYKKTENNFFNNNNKNEIFIKSLENFDSYRSNSNNILKDNKINLKKNIDYNMRSEYIINRYKNKLSNYNYI